MDNHLYFVPESSIIKGTENGTMLQASAVVSLYCLGVSTMSDYKQLPLQFPPETIEIELSKT